MGYIFKGTMTVMANSRVVIVGVTSFGNDFGCGLKEFPTVGARISFVRDWILDHTDAGEWQCEQNGKIPKSIQAWLRFNQLYYHIFG